MDCLIGFKYQIDAKLKPDTKIGVFLALLMNAKYLETETSYAVSSS